jgi:S1-C subfamily serine protease
MNLGVEPCVGRETHHHAERPMLLHTLLALTVVASPAHRSVAADSTDAKARPSTTTAAAAARRNTTFGVAIAPVPDAIRALPYLEADEGVMIAQVQDRSAAATSGLRAGDLVLSVDGKRVDETTIFAAVRQAPRNKAFRVEYLRDGGWRETWVKIEK